MTAAFDRLRGGVPAKRHNARTIAALTANPGCTRRAVLDAAGIDKPRLAERIGFPGNFGQSRFALARGNGFEAMLKADGCALLLSVLRDVLHLDEPAVSYDDLGEDDDATLGARHGRTRDLLAAAAGAALIDHPLLTLQVAGRSVFLEPDLIAFHAGGRLHVVEIKSFAIVDGQADSAKVSAAAVQAAVYVLALRRLLADLGHDPALVSHDAVLVCPRDFSLQPTAVLVDVRKQLSTLKRQLARLASVSELAAALPDDLSFDTALPPETLTAALARVGAKYAPECLSACELAAFCRHEATGTTAALGRPVRDALGGVDTVAEALALAAGTATPPEELAEAAALLQAAARLRAEAVGAATP
ncbi:hypothetical protein Asp14428_34950 [Actinoplanes sp. NBRC 14428]|uniref:Secreted protein n=1 Tax=Pseudosporangium ferrugineum TaxID=439699 RepID=A0A2T0S387_9ACTN|nr:hypothetical protein [Pseudosporangium ferrugineum]PRY27885.1 hypothetical protein CLV70_10939 [Pseudosporangium ferrugineum]BCJ52020.1 hypothetical protein Asp14428_34950 [Actinoplanes sp. NBRC 14428]